MKHRSAALAGWLGVACATVSPWARAHDVAPPARALPAKCPNCCRFSADLGPRMGGSVNADQWLVGGYLRTSLPCLGDLGLGPLLVFGVGGNHFTVRSAGRLDYMLWLDGDHDFGLYPTVGASVLFYAPIGPFATFCDRVDLDECSGHLLGGEVGGGVRFRSFVVDAVVGFGGLPVLTILGAFALPVDGSGAP